VNARSSLGRFSRWAAGSCIVLLLRAHKADRLHPRRCPQSWFAAAPRSHLLGAFVEIDCLEVKPKH
jgi:hypothetical protein